MTHVGKNTHHTDFAVGDKVNIDGDTSIAAVVTGICIYAFGIVYDVSWFNEGVAENDKFDTFRLSNAGEQT